MAYTGNRFMIVSSKSKHVIAIVFCTLMLLSISVVVARNEHDKNKQNNYKGIYKVNGAPSQTILNINNMSMWARDDGLTERRPQDNNSGVSFPSGTSTVIYAGGLIWGGYVNDGGAQNPRVGGQTYNYGTVPGRIISKGVAESPNDASVRIYRIRRDWKDADLTRDAAQFFDIGLSSVSPGQVDQVRLQYKKDWLEWPWQKGAPYYDWDSNGVYNPDPNFIYGKEEKKDEPGLGGADQVVWFVANDLDGSHATGLYGSNPIGIEMQFTAWAYNSTGALGNVIFQKYRITYKGTATTPANAVIDPMYLAKWVDPDLGDYGDDYAGCDTTRSLGYVYNGGPVDAEFKKFNLTPPAVGYDFFQGPKDTSGKVFPMTTFAYFAAHGTDYDPDLGNNYNGTLQWFNLLRGFRPRPIAPSDCHHDPTQGGACTNFMLPGDPANLAGWIDGRIDPPGDRRIVLASGPFRMKLNETQEVVIGLIGSIGKDYLDAIDVLKNTDDEAQRAFDLNFELPSQIPSPNLRIVELNKKLILDWESDTAQTRKCESYSSKGYNFETYRIYQFPLASSTLDQAKRFPAFDITGARYRQITADKIRDHELINGQRYYFGVSTVVYNRTFGEHRESAIVGTSAFREAIPHAPNPGTVYPYQLDTPLVNLTKNLVGINDANVTFSYFDPTRADGHSYKIVFHVDTLTTCDLVDTTSNEMLLQRVEVKDIPAPQRVISREFTFKAGSPPVGIKGVFQSASSGNPSMHVPVFETVDPGNSFMLVGHGANISTTDSLKGYNRNDRNIEIRFIPGDSSWALLRNNSSKWFDTKFIRVPYTVWQLKSLPTDTVRQIYSVIEDHVGSDNLWHPSALLERKFNGKEATVFYPLTILVAGDTVSGQYYAGSYDDSIGLRPDSVVGPFGWDADEYVGNTKATLLNLTGAASGLSSTSQVAINRLYIVDYDEDGKPVPDGTVISLEKYKPVREGDTKIFQSQKVQSYNISAAKQEIQKINVFPNPYYGLNRSERSRFARFVTFNHLPSYAKIRIFNLAGVLVRTITKQDAPTASSQFIQWDLSNESELPVASGMYIAYIELKSYDEQGKLVDMGTKTLKLMIVQEQQFLESF